MTPTLNIKTRVKLFLGALVITLFLTRLYLFFFPHSNFNFGAYNIHHLFLGAFLLIVSTIFLVIDVVRPIVLLIAGISTALITDELLYLIATDGSDAAYLTPISFWGALVATSVVILIMGGIYYGITTKQR